jgi:hypothetical protein
MEKTALLADLLLVLNQPVVEMRMHPRVVREEASKEKAILRSERAN